MQFLLYQIQGSKVKGQTINSGLRTNCLASSEDLTFAAPNRNKHVKTLGGLFITLHERAILGWSHLLGSVV